MLAGLAMGVLRTREPAALENGDAAASPLTGKSFCFTGELRSMKRPEAEKKIRELGGSAKSSVAKDLDYLVTNDPASGSSKNRKAREYGVAIIDEEAFLALLASALQSTRPAQ